MTITISKILISMLSKKFTVRGTLSLNTAVVLYIPHQRGEEDVFIIPFVASLPLSSPTIATASTTLLLLFSPWFVIVFTFTASSLVLFHLWFLLLFHLLRLFWFLRFLFQRFEVLLKGSHLKRVIHELFTIFHLPLLDRHQRVFHQLPLQVHLVG